MKITAKFYNNIFNIFIFLFFLIGVILSLKVGITHDEFHELESWNINKQIYSNYLLNKNLNTEFPYFEMGFYGIGFHLVSAPIEFLTGLLISVELGEEFKEIIIKHPSVFIFFILSGLYFKKIMFLITRDKNYANLCTVVYLLYPYLLGHSFFNLKDIPFLSVWMLSTFYLIRLFTLYHRNKKISFKHLFILSTSTAYLFSIRISGILILIEYLIFFLVFLNIYHYKVSEFLFKNLKYFVFFIIILISIFFSLHPNYWDNPFMVINSIKYMSQHIQTACTVTLGECMKAQDLPSSYIPIWLFFKLPILILIGIAIFPFTEKKMFSDQNIRFIVGALIITILFIIFFLIFSNVNLYDELRQIMFLVPLFLIIGFTSIYFFSKKMSLVVLPLLILLFVHQNIKIFPYNYVWLNNFTHLTQVNGMFELDYWGVSSKNVSNFIKQKKIKSNECIVSNGYGRIKVFLNEQNKCILPLNNLHKKNKRPFYVILMERLLNKGLPNNCKLIHNEEINLNYSKESLIMAKIFKCT